MKVKVKGQILNFLVNALPPEPFDVSTSIFVASCDLDLKVKVKYQIICFLLNVSPPKRLNVATSNFVAGKVT